MNIQPHPLPHGYLRQATAENLTLLILVLIYTAGVFLAAWLVGRINDIDLNIYTSSIGTFALGSAILGLLGYLLYVVVIVHPPRPVAYILRHWTTQLRWWERLTIGTPLLFILPLFFSVFTSMKALIPVFNPYHWDTVFADWDRWLAGGLEPWQRLDFLLHWPHAVFALNFLYNVWIFALYGLLLWQAFSLSDRHLRLQFFLAFLLAWMLLGTIVATALSSAGPCFYAQVIGTPDPYAGLMASLRHINEVVPVWAFSTQQMLWGSYASGHLVLGSGISAMPSMHLATALLYALVMWRKHCLLGVLAYLYLGALVIGSIILGWHYAVDGLVALAGTTVIWQLAGFLSTRIRAATGTGEE